MQKVYPIRSFRRHLQLVAVAALLTQPVFAATVTLPASSEDGLAAAIASAGPGGTVIVASGVHRESSTVLVDIPVSIVGDLGSVIEGDTAPNSDANPPDFIDPVLHIQGTEGTSVEGISILPAEGSIGNTAILIQDAPRTTIKRNAISNHEYGIVLQGGDSARVRSNDIRDVPLFGILVINGRFVHVQGNTVMRAGVFGIWVCDRDGVCISNSVSDSFIGFMLCRFAAGDAILPDGSAAGADFSSTGWLVANNEAHHNQVFGYLVTDGANNNHLANNNAWNNGVLDMLLDSANPVAPPSFENLIVLGSHSDILVVDIGVDNTIVGKEP